MSLRNKKRTIEELDKEIKESKPFRLILFGVLLYLLILLLISFIGDIAILRHSTEEWVNNYKWLIGSILLMFLMDNTNEIMYHRYEIERLKILVKRDN